MGPLEIKGIILGLGVLVGAFCLFLGYRLYDRGVLEKGKAEAQGAGVTVKLSDYGPGVVFALFGAGIIIFCVTRTLSSDTKTTTYQAVPAEVSAGPAGASPAPDGVARTTAPVPATTTQSHAEAMTIGPQAGAPQPTLQVQPAPASKGLVISREGSATANAPPTQPAAPTTTIREEHKVAVDPKKLLDCSESGAFCPS
jgi:hypothetical protein